MKFLVTNKYLFPPPNKLGVRIGNTIYLMNRLYRKFTCKSLFEFLVGHYGHAYSDSLLLGFGANHVGGNSDAFIIAALCNMK